VPQRVRADVPRDPGGLRDALHPCRSGAALDVHAEGPRSPRSALQQPPRPAGRCSRAGGPTHRGAQ
jgi:hypothetical protein